jgi:hypothetical protein
MERKMKKIERFVPSVTQFLQELEVTADEAVVGGLFQRLAGDA